MLPKKREFKGKKIQMPLYVHEDFKDWLDKTRGEKSRAAFLEDLAFKSDEIVKKRARAIEQKYEAQVRRLLKPFQDSFGRVERIEEWLFGKAYEKCSKCGKPKIPGKDMFELRDEADVVYIAKKSCLCAGG